MPKPEKPLLPKPVGVDEHGIEHFEQPIFGKHRLDPADANTAPAMAPYSDKGGTEVYRRFQRALARAKRKAEKEESGE